MYTQRHYYTTPLLMKEFLCSVRRNNAGINSELEILAVQVWTKVFSYSYYFPYMYFDIDLRSVSFLNSQLFLLDSALFAMKNNQLNLQKGNQFASI